MKVRAKQTTLTGEQKESLGVSPAVNSQWQFSVGRDYLVYALTCMHSVGVYGKSVLYTLVDDYGRLLPAPDCLFDVIDPRVSRYWVVQCSREAIRVAPKEFFDNPFLTEEVLDREGDALDLFANIKSLLEVEAAENPERTFPRKTV